MSEPTIPLRMDVTEDELMCLIDTLEAGAKNTAAALAPCKSLLLKITEALENEAAQKAASPAIARRT
jgi:hypothetical protein